MRFLVVFREDSRRDGSILDTLGQHLGAFRDRGNVQVQGETAMSCELLAAIFEAPSREALDAMLAACPSNESIGLDVVALHDQTGFPLEFGRSRGHLAAWEKLIAASRG